MIILCNSITRISHVSWGLEGKLDCVHIRRSRKLLWVSGIPIISHYFLLAFAVIQINFYYYSCLIFFKAQWYILGVSKVQLHIIKNTQIIGFLNSHLPLLHCYCLILFEQHLNVSITNKTLKFIMLIFWRIIRFLTKNWQLKEKYLKSMYYQKW